MFTLLGFRAIGLEMPILYPHHISFSCCSSNAGWQFQTSGKFDFPVAQFFSP